jgi:hypothetical protein
MSANLKEMGEAVTMVIQVKVKAVTIMTTETSNNNNHCYDDDDFLYLIKDPNLFNFGKTVYEVFLNDCSVCFSAILI